MKPITFLAILNESCTINYNENFHIQHCMWHYDSIAAVTWWCCKLTSNVYSRSCICICLYQRIPVMLEHQCPPKRKTLLICQPWISVCSVWSLFMDGPVYSRILWKLLWRETLTAIIRFAIISNTGRINQAGWFDAKTNILNPGACTHL